MYLQYLRHLVAGQDLFWHKQSSIFNSILHNSAESYKTPRYFAIEYSNLDNSKISDYI